LVDLGIGVSVEAEEEESICRTCDGGVLGVCDGVTKLEVRPVRDYVPVGRLESKESDT